MNSPITPTIGRIVLVTVQIPGKPSFEAPAIVSGVNPDNSDAIYVTVFEPGVAPYPIGGIEYSEDKDDLTTWRWMPYQREQAKKAEDVPVLSTHPNGVG